ncbi:MAG TPA: hypothetical protein VFX70_02490, partial [Mycobacteriales bacterium]|nr:hypothetical protein [Mycobacteriales bacterium]
MRSGQGHPADPAAPAAGLAEAAGAAEATVASSDIARLADVGKAAVSNWRRRFDDFPEPVAGTSSAPRFRLADVEDWMTRHGREFRVGAVDRVWQQIASAVEDLRLGEVVGAVGAVLVLARRDPDRWSALAGRPDPDVPGALGPAVVAAVPEVAAGPAPVEPGWVPAIRAVAELAAGRGHAEVFGLICDRYIEAHSRRVPVTPPDIAALMVHLAGVSRGDARGRR